MARNKKVKQTPLNQNVGVKIDDKVKYEGNVQIRLVKDGRVVKDITKHNSGNIPLFLFLANCLLGQFQSTGIPNYITLGYYSEQDGVNTYTNLSSSAILSGNSYLLDSNQVNYEFTIPTVTISSSGINDNITINRLRLYNTENLSTFKNQDDNNYSAEVEVSGLNVPISDIGKYTIFVIWTLTLSDANSSQN